MELIFVLLSDWNSAKDPVPYYGMPPGDCLDFNNRRAKPRSLLELANEAVMSDCEHGVDYDIAVCRVRP